MRSPLSLAGPQPKQRFCGAYVSWMLFSVTRLIEPQRHRDHREGFLCVLCVSVVPLERHHIGEEFVEEAFELVAVNILQKMNRRRELRTARQSMRDAAECEADSVD